MAQTKTMRRRGDRWIVWHDAYLADPRLVSPIDLPAMEEADVQAALDARLVRMAAEADTEPLTIELSEEDCDALASQVS